ncbi:hypothetical protein RZ67_00320 [[Haemophilus] ducreyi]|nr:hypothetical protein RZ67_00320 [[Haemophilus] ducreyi]
MFKAGVNWLRRPSKMALGLLILIISACTLIAWSTHSGYGTTPLFLFAMPCTTSRRESNYSK